MMADWHKRRIGWMATVLTLIGGLFGIAGCGDANDPNPGTPPSGGAGTSGGSDAGKGDGDATAADAIDSENLQNDASSLASSVPVGAAEPGHADALAASDADVAADIDWLETQVRLGAKYRATADYRQEAEHWAGVVVALQERLGAGHWLTAGARLSRGVAVRLSEMSVDDLVAWKRFESLERTFLQNKTELEELRSRGKITPQQYINATKDQLKLLTEQADIIDRLFERPCHLMANVAFNQAETLSTVEAWEPAWLAAERCLSVRMAALQVRHPDQVAVLQLMGHVAESLGRPQVAEDCFLRAVRMAEQVWGPQHLAFATHANDLGVHYYKCEVAKAPSEGKDFSKANYWLDKGLKIREGQLSAEHHVVALSKRNLGLSKLAEATSKPADRQALDLGVANFLLTSAAESLNADPRVARSLVWQVQSDAATVKMLLHEYAEADALLGGIAKQWEATTPAQELPLSPPVLFYRWGLACAKQKTTEKIDEAAKRMRDAIRLGTEASADASTVEAARTALARLNEVAAEGVATIIADRQPSGKTESLKMASQSEGEVKSPVRMVALPPVDGPK
jgi:tetratricopeptide (TPR) repeat protein